jgi:ribosomal protein S12
MQIAERRAGVMIEHSHSTRRRRNQAHMELRRLLRVALVSLLLVLAYVALTGVV